jgi:hypothetical protein
MSDEFLKQFRERPRPEFAEALYQKINRPRRSIIMLKRLAFTAIALALAVATLFAVSPQARAAFLALIEEIGGIDFVVTEEYPGSGGRVETVPSEVVSLEEARQRLPYTFGLPTWVPEGYTLQSEVELLSTDGTESRNDVTLIWENEIGSRIYLYVRPGGEGRSWIVGPEGVEEVTLNGEPAALIRGAWNAHTKEYDLDPSMLQLTWEQDEVQYNLTYFTSSDFSDADAIRMAESIP